MFDDNNSTVEFQLLGSPIFCIALRNKDILFKILNDQTNDLSYVYCRTVVCLTVIGYTLLL